MAEVATKSETPTTESETNSTESEPVIVDSTEDATVSTYSYTEIRNYVIDQKYPPGKDKEYKRGLRKHSKFFTVEGDRLYYIGGKKKQKPRLVFEREEEQKKIITTIHDQGHFGRDKTMS